MFGDSNNRRMRDHSRRISRDVDRMTYGSHAGGTLPHGRHGSYGKGVNFSSQRKSARARSGEINVVMPNTSSGESRRAHARRVSQPDFGMRSVRRARVRSAAIVVVLLLIVAAVAIGAAVFAFVNSVNAKMSLDNSEATSLLVAPAANEPYYAVIAGIFGESGGDDEADTVVVARVDTANSQVALLAIPSNLKVNDSSGDEVFLAQTYAEGGDAALIKQVSQLIGEDVSRYVRIDAEGFVRMVDLLGGITVNVPEEADDPYAGSIYIAPGEQTLSGEAALVYVRARNYEDSTVQRGSNQLDVMAAIAQKTMDLGTAGLPGFVDALAECIKTDYSASDLTALVEGLRGMDVSSMVKVQMPGAVYADNGGRPEFVNSSSWSSVLESFVGSGTAVENATVDTSGVDPGSFTITVRNGGGITGAAANFSSILTERGYQVVDVGNADSQVYQETLVVYKDDAMATAAQAVVDAMGVGRTTNASAYYSFDSDVLVMIGTDYEPTA